MEEEERERVKRLTRMGTDRFFLGGGMDVAMLAVVVASSSSRVDDEKWRVPVCYCISIYTHSGSCWFWGGVEGSVSEDASVPVSLKFGWRPGRLKVFFFEFLGGIFMLFVFHVLFHAWVMLR